MITFFSCSGGIMRGWCFIAGMLFLLIAGLAGADYLSTTISSDGSVMLASAGSDENGSLASRVMTLDAAKITRSMTGDSDLHSDLLVVGAGPFLISDVASGFVKAKELVSGCVFLDNAGDHRVGESSVYATGIMQKGEYDASRSIGSDLIGLTAVNGSGMMMLGTQRSDNKSLFSRGFVTGNMSIHDFVRYGGKV